MSTVSYEYDDEGLGKADNPSSRIDSSGPYIGRFKSVNAMTARNTGTHGVHFEFDAVNGGGTASFDLYTQKEDGTKVFGLDMLQAIQTILGLRGLKSKQGKYEGFVDGKREEVEGEIFPDLMDKDIGLVLQKEKYTKGDGNDGFRMNLYGVFHPTSRLTASELKERVTTPAKLEKILKGLKDKDVRTVRAPEPAQPSVGADAGSY